MKLKTLVCWENVDALEGLLFFAQTIDEMLFDYTLDSYKVPALNTRLLCHEAIRVAMDVKSGAGHINALKPVVEELSASLISDPAARHIIGSKHELYYDALKSANTSLSEQLTILQSLNRLFSQKKYFEVLKELLTGAIRDGKEKDLIITLSRSLMTELINLKYSQGYIYYCVQRYFFSDKNIKKIKSNDDIGGFFGFFDFNEHTYEVICKGNHLFSLLSEACGLFVIECRSDKAPSTGYYKEREFLSDLPAGWKYLVSSGVKSLDHQGARTEVEKRLEVISDLIGYYHHKSKPAWSKGVLVRREDDNIILIIDEPVKAILKRSDINPEQAAQLTCNALRTLPDSLTRESFVRYARALDFHGLALEAAATENQLLDLWATLETLFPAELDNRKSRIAYITSQVIPFLRRKYINKLLVDLTTDLKIWNNAEFAKSLMSISAGASELEKVAALLVLPAYEKIADDLLGKMDTYPALRNRIFTLHKAFADVKSIKRTLERHSQRVEWHFMRIYRTRNKIIHAGQTPSFATLLVEHLHSYLDLVLEQIQELALSDGTIKTIEEAALKVRFSVEHHDRLLQRSTNVVCDENNYVGFLFGDQ